MKALSYSIEWEGPVVRLRFAGSIDSSELGAVVNQVASHPSFDNLRFQMLDFTDSTLPQFDEKLLHALAPVFGASHTNPRIALVMVPDNGPTRALCDFCAPLLVGFRSVQFFPTRLRAEDWISGQLMAVSSVK